jgi:AGCS family alanine or glycine:cation symporter
MWGIFEVFADTIVVCTLTAITILSSGVIDLETGMVSEIGESVSSSTYMSFAFSQSFGPLGAAFIALAILLFAYSTVLGWSHYGATACHYLFGDKSILPYRIVFVVVVFLGSIMKAQLAWDISDTFNGLMMIPNLIGVLVLSPLVMKCTKNYVDRKLHGKKIRPMLSMFPDIQQMQEEAIANAKTEEDAE